MPATGYAPDKPSAAKNIYPSCEQRGIGDHPLNIVVWTKPMVAA